MKTSYVIVEVDDKLTPNRIFHHNGSRSILDRFNVSNITPITIHDDDSLFEVAQRLELYAPHTQAKAMYFWTEQEPLSCTITYRRTGAPFEIAPAPSDKMLKKLPADRDILLVRNDTTGRLMAPLSGTVIYAVSYANYAAYLSKIKDTKPFMWVYFDATAAAASAALSKSQVAERQLTVEHLDEIVTLVQQSPAKPIETTIFEAVIHINYDLEQEPFINLEKIFTMIQVNQEQPFVRYRSERGILPKFKIYDELTNKDSPLFISRSIMEDWMELNRNAVDDAGLKSLANKGLTFRLTNYETDGKTKYMTVNIFPDGKVELKTYWDEGIGATELDMEKSIAKVRSFLQGVNKLQYHLPGVKRTQRIPLPDKNNTRVVFYNRIGLVKFNEPVTAESFKTFLHQFTPYVAPMIKPVTESAVEIRYKRVAYYLSQPSIFKFIRTFRETESVGLEKAVMDVFYPYDLASAKSVITRYDNTSVAPAADGEKRIRKYHLVKQPGIDIKFIPVSSSAGDLYKCLILGVNQEQLAEVTKFIGAVIEAYNLGIPIPVRAAKSAAAAVAPTTVATEDEEAVAFVPRARGRKPASEAAAPVAKKPAVVKVIQNMLGYLRIADPASYDKARYSTSRNEEVVYSRKCQKIHQPLVVSVKFKDLIETTLINELAAAEAEIKTTPAGKKYDRLERQIKSLKYNRIGFDNGKLRGNKFFFCPFTWDWSNHNLMEAGKPPIFPIQDDGSATSYTASVKPDQDPIFPSNLYAFESLPDETGKSHQGFCCKFRERKARSIAATATAAQEQADLVVPASAPLERTVNLRYVLDHTKFPAFNRWAELPPQINRLFNPDDTGFLIQDHTFVHGFNHYLRRGMRRGLSSNSFIDALFEIYPTRDILKELVGKVTNARNGEKFFKSLKQGSLYNLFLPSVSDADAAEVAAFYPAKLVVDRFVKWINQYESSVNEDILWDFVSEPSTMFPEGINIVIIELDEVKCPVGFDLEKLIKFGRPTIVMYKSQDIYELVCHVTYKHGDIKSTAVYPKSNPISKSLLSTMNHECEPFENRELPAAAIGLTTATGSNKGLTLFETMRKLQLLPKSVISEFKSFTQIIDSYNKVVFLRINDPQPKPQSIWIPVEPSGIIEQLPIEPLYDILDSLPDIESTVKTMLVLYLYGGFEGYQPDNFLLGDGDSVIGVTLKNGLMIFCSPEPLQRVEKVTIKVKTDIAEHSFNFSSLVYGADKQTDYWQGVKLMERDYANFVKRGKRPVATVDARWIYSVRQSFEQETYARLRYELSKFMQTRQGKGLRDEIMYFLKRDTPADDKRRGITTLIETASEQLVTTAEDAKIVESIGPIGGMNYEQLVSNDISSRYSYIRPNIRYECFNRDLDRTRGDDPHCSGGKLFVPRYNLITGEPDNLENYIHRIVEEIIRVPMKRNEILDDQVDNSVNTGTYVTRKGEYYSDGNTILSDIDYLYSLNNDYLDRMSKQYDIVNPKRFKRDTPTGKYRIDVLPEHWIREFKTVEFRVYSKLGDYGYIYDQLDTALGAHSKIELANFVSAMTDDEQGVIRDYYRSVMGDEAGYPDMKQGILSNANHRMNQMDLMILSRVLNFRPVILTDDTVNCLQSTQTISDKFILFVLTLAGDYHIVKRGDKTVFSMFELPKALFDICPADNTRVIQDLAASLQRIALDAVPDAATVAPEIIIAEPERCQCVASTTGERCKNAVTDDPSKNRAYCDLHQYCNRRFDEPRRKFIRKKNLPEEVVAIPDNERCKCIASTTNSRCKNRVLESTEFCEIHQSCKNSIDEPVKRVFKRKI